jgi:excisionase family DNA binding protein
MVISVSPVIDCDRITTGRGATLTDNAPLSPRAAADLLTRRGFPMSYRTVIRKCENEELAADRTKGGWYRIRRSELERWIRDNT